MSSLYYIHAERGGCQVVKSMFFDDKKLACPCGCGKNNATQKLVNLLDTIYYAMSKTLTVTSVCRCEKHNAAVGGEKNSKHLDGEAVDIAATLPTDRYYIVKLALMNGGRCVEVCADHVHIDVRLGPPMLLLGAAG